MDGVQDDGWVDGQEAFKQGDPGFTLEVWSKPSSAKALYDHGHVLGRTN
jgi:hypothetical protein